MIETLKTALNYFILICELEEIERQKHIAVKAQSFELAVKWRDGENKLRVLIPTLDDLRAVREKLNTEYPNQSKDVAT